MMRGGVRVVGEKKTTGTSPKKQKKRPLDSYRDCTFRGSDLTGFKRQELNLSHGERWAKCSHADKPKGEYVCPCKGCGPKCSGYVERPEGETD